MNLPSAIRRLLLLALPLALLGAPSRLPAAESGFSSSPTLSAEAELLMGILNQFEFNRAAVHSGDFAEVIPDYMTAIDGQHLFFLADDKRRFEREYGSTVFYNVAYLGNLDPAYDIFNEFETRLKSRVDWVFTQLKGDVDLTSDEKLAIDRSKAAWPASQDDSDALWRKRLKFELLTEILNGKSQAQAREIVRKRYVMMRKNLGDTEAGDLAELYLSTVTMLYDPHSAYFSPDSFDEFNIQLKLHLIGIGAVLSMKDNYCTVEQVVAGGPADLGHQLKPNDKLISVAQDGKEAVEVLGMPVRKIVKMIRGPKGTRVHLIVEPANAKDAATRKEIVITRDVVKLNSARAHAGLFQVPGADGKTVPLGVVALPEFYFSDDPSASAADRLSATADVGRLIAQLQKAGMRGLVLDLRHNGGGSLPEAINLTGLFIHPGPVVQVRESNGNVTVLRDEAPQVAYTGPLAVLVDRMSASASEIVAGALQNYGRAIIVGDSSTHGKGTVQNLMQLKDLSPELAESPTKAGAAKITIQKFYLPNGSSTQLKGVVPDIILPSVDDTLPIGESSLPHALVWDRIDGASFDGNPIDLKTLATLRSDSSARQSRLEEFSYLRKIVDWFKAREAEKLVSLNLGERRKEKVADDLFKKQLTAERNSLAKGDYPIAEFRLGPVTPKLASRLDDDTGNPEEDSVLSIDEDNESFGKMDVHLRETLRILDDAIDLGKNPGYWASDHAPLTIADKDSAPGKGWGVESPNIGPR